MNRDTVFIIEDEPAILETIEYNLKREGFRVESSGDGSQGLVRVQDSLPSLVIVDLMLPGLDGLEICRRLKASPATRHIPLMILSAKSEESDIVLGLGVGADEYVTKPFSPRELVARVKALLRRGPLHDVPGARQLVTRGGLRIDPTRYEVHVDGEPVAFTATEFRLLHWLASNAGRVFTREQLIDRAIGEDADIVDRNIDVHVRAVREKLGLHRKLLETIRGIGYRFSDHE